MAYTDTRARPSGTSIGAAVAINGLMIAGIIFAAPDVLPKIPPITQIIPILTKPIDEPPETPKPRPKRPIEHKQAVTPEAGRQTSASSNADTDYVLPQQPPFTPGAGGTVIEEPPVKLTPIFKQAQLNPRYAGSLQPTYPPGMIRAELEGVVTVRVLIGTDGRVKQVEAVRSDQEAFLEATRRQALGKWRFIPATRDGEPVESWREMTVRFQLPD